MDTPERRDSAPKSPMSPMSSTSPMTRRHALGGVAAAAAAIPLLAACGGDTSGTSGGSDDSAAGNKADKAPKTSTKTPEAGDDTKTPGDDDAAKGGGADSGGAALTSTSDIPVKGGKIFTAQKVVVTQPQQGTFKAFSAICTHRGCPVGSVADDVIHCPCHGSAFSAADGSVKNGPATSPLKPVKIEVEGSSIKLA